MTQQKVINKAQIVPVALSALGVVFGDIGTSPLYAMNVTLGPLALNQTNILGVLSLIFWSLILIISLKYLVIVFRADNDGEGGSLALLALLKQKATKHEHLFYLLAIFGAGLLLGDGMITPAISVISAIEGLELMSPHWADVVLPLSCVILVFLFMIQSKGTSKIGMAFGPILFLWFVVIAMLGTWHIILTPVVLQAINPYYAFVFLMHQGLRGYLVLGGVFLVVTGGEALYADIGHFGKNPIRLSWFFVVLPCLVLSYFGQGAHLLTHPAAIQNPFYLLAPSWFMWPLLILATCATIIASQAVISATFSLTKQAILLGLCPRIPVIQTSRHHAGQIYIPQMNMLLFVGTLLLLFTFRSSSALAHAYGIAVNLVMFLVTAMVAYAAHKVWLWSIPRVCLIFSLFLMIDLAFLGANAHKFLTGGWVPVVFALFIAFVMYTWNMGMEYLKKNFYMQKSNLTKIAKQLDYKTLNRLMGVTAIFITDFYDRSGGSFLHFLKLSLAVPEHILIVNYKVHNTPHVEEDKKFDLEKINDVIYQVTLHYGFMDTVSIPHGLAHVDQQHVLPFAVNIHTATFLVETPHIVASKTKRTLWFYRQEMLFAFLMRNYSSNLHIEFYKLPYNRTIAIGSYCAI